ncbi:ATP-binding protein [Dongia sp.]|jgi:two-component system osmolarity sensor histidine kinase EnvZ|uniref:ATP-binding protein n=1 Tax=Dongia sp. TaxID=1977262 RepID=UPI0035B2675C
MNTLLQEWLIGIERVLPRSLLGRSILIIVTPIVLLQVISAWVFYDSHWNTVTKRLAQSVAGEIGAVTRLMPRAGSAPSGNEVAIHALFETARQDMGLNLEFKPGEILPNDPTIMRQNLVDRQLARALEDLVERPFIIDSRSLEKYIEIHVQLADGVLHVVVLRRRLFSSTTYVFLLWMVGTSLALLAVATLFMRNQVKPIKRLAQAADDFGKGREVADFRIEGATEVTLAGQAFNQMRNRIRRQIAQRTEMLAGVSHDLRTPLTRMKLQLAMMGENSEITDLKKDVADMERMIGAYLAFARGEGMEQPAPTDLAELVADVVGDARRQGATIELKLPARDIVVPLRRDAFRRALDNVIGNAHRYAGAIGVTMVLRPRHVEVMVDDDGPGIPAEAREDVFKPFFRLEQSRNQETGGTGLGLTIARDIVRGHGGDLVLSDAPGGGLRAVLRLPL